MGKSHGMYIYLLPGIQGIPLGRFFFFLVMHDPINQKCTRKFTPLVLYVL